MRAKKQFSLILGVGIVSAIYLGGPRLTSAMTNTLAVQFCANHARPTLLADEINRRLSRLGISFNRMRLPHPYDAAGEMC